MLDAIVHNLEQSNHIARIKKLVFCACTNNWSNEAQQLSTVKFTSYLQQLRDRYASTVELKYLLYRIVIRLNHSSNYYTVANLICEQMEPLYSQEMAATNIPSAISSALDAQIWGREVIFVVEEAQSGSMLQIDMTVLSANHQLLGEARVMLPNAAQLLAQYQEWQSRYRKLDPQNHRLISNKAVSLVPERINDCLDAGAMLQANIHQWYNSAGFQTIRDRLATHLDPEQEVDFIVRSRSKMAIRLPWNSIWQPLLDRYPQSEVSISLLQTPADLHTESEELVVSVLSILASAQGIKIDRSKEYLNALPHTQSEFVVAPTHTDFVNLLTQKSWSAIFLSSYISGYLPNNRIYLNHHDTVSIPELKHRLHSAVDRGLKLLILNCGDGIDLASELIDLEIPHLIVMREAVQDQVAQEFVKLLLKSFAGGKSLQLSVREARERLQAIEKVVPAASWLPVICQHIPDSQSSWRQMARTVSNLTDTGESHNQKLGIEATNIVQYIDPVITGITKPIEIAYSQLTLLHQLTGYFSEVYSLALSKDRQWLVSGHGDITHVDNAVKVWRISDGKLIHNLLGHNEAICGVALTNDAETIISASLDGNIQSWQLTTGTMLPQLIDRKYPINAIAVTRDGRKLITGGSDAIVRVWQPEDKLLIHRCQGHLQNIDCLATHQESQLIASGSSDYTVRLWHLQEGRLLRILLGHSSRVSSVAITPDGKKVVSASHDRTIKIWDAATGNPIDTLLGHSKPIGCLAISANGQTIVSGSDDGTVNIWNLNDPKLLRSISTHDRAILAVAISADGRTITTGGYGEIQIWQVPD